MRNSSLNSASVDRLVKSPILVKEVVNYDGDPNDAGAPLVLQRATGGTLYLQDSAGLVWKREANSESWIKLDVDVKEETPVNTDYKSSRIFGTYAFSSI